MARTKAKHVILELIRQSPDGIWDGKSKLFKGFYFAHLFYAKNEPGILTDWPIAHTPNGPGIDHGEDMLKHLEQKGHLKIHAIHDGPYPESRYELTEKGRSDSPPPDDARKAISEAAKFVLPRSSGELTQFTNEHSRSYREGKPGDILDIYIDLVPDDEYAKEQKKLAELNQQLSMALFEEQAESAA